MHVLTCVCNGASNMMVQQAAREEERGHTHSPSCHSVPSSNRSHNTANCRDERHRRPVNTSSKAAVTVKQRVLINSVCVKRSETDETTSSLPQLHQVLESNTLKGHFDLSSTETYFLVWVWWAHLKRQDAGQTAPAALLLVQDSSGRLLGPSPPG